MLGDVALRVGLHQQIKVSSLIVGGDRGIRADDGLGVAGDLSLQGNVLADGKTEDVSGARQGKAVDGDIVRDISLLREGKILEIGGVEDFA